MGIVLMVPPVAASTTVSVPASRLATQSVSPQRRRLCRSRSHGRERRGVGAAMTDRPTIDGQRPTATNAWVLLEDTPPTAEVGGL